MKAPLNNNTRKVVIIGAGYVGATIAYSLMLRNTAEDIVLINRSKNKLISEVLDIQHGLQNFGTSDVRHGDYSDCRDANLIIITVGRNRKAEETRLDLLRDNLCIIDEVIDKIKPHYTKGAILVISNPVDILTYRCETRMNLQDGKVFGTGTILDASRLTRVLADYINVAPEMINASVVGEHGDSQIPIWSKITVCGSPIDNYCADNTIEWDSKAKSNIEEKVRNMGSTIISGKGRTHFGIAICACYIANAILNQKRIIAPVTSILKGEYGIDNVAISVPSVIGSNGIERRLEQKWSDNEIEAFKSASNSLKHHIEELGI